LGICFANSWASSTGMVLSAEPWTVKNLNRDNSMSESMHNVRAILAQWKLNENESKYVSGLID